MKEAYMMTGSLTVKYAIESSLDAKIPLGISPSAGIIPLHPKGLVDLGYASTYWDVGPGPESVTHYFVWDDTRPLIFYWLNDSQKTLYEAKKGEVFTTLTGEVV